MILTGDTCVLRTPRRTCPSVTSCSTNPIWNNPGTKPGLPGDRLSINGLSHGIDNNLNLILKDIL
jgi:hypothetical protein